MISQNDKVDLGNLRIEKKFCDCISSMRKKLWKEDLFEVDVCISIANFLTGRRCFTQVVTSVNEVL